MKRDHTDGGSCGGGDGGSCGGSYIGGKSKMMIPEGEPQDAGVDDLLAVLGYKVRSSEMADVAQKLEQLEMAMVNGAGVGGCALDENAVLAHLASETVHYNPSDISNWLENMLSELNAPPFRPAPSVDAPCSSFYALDHHPAGRPSPPSIIVEDSLPPAESSSYDLHAIPGRRVVSGRGESAKTTSRDKKRLKSSPPSVSTAATRSGAKPSVASTAANPSEQPSTESPMPVVLVDSQENGIRLVHTLMACAEAVQQGNVKAAEALVKQVGVLAVSQGGAMRKVATCFAEALARRIFRIHPAQDQCLVDAAIADVLEAHFYESCPYLKFAHFTANQAILEAFSGRNRVHVIDFSMKQGLQWPALMQALALRPGGPPSFRLTGIGPPQPDNTDALQQVGWKLAQLAESMHVEFKYGGFSANSLADLEPYMLDVAAARPFSPSSSSSGGTANCGKSDGGDAAGVEEEAVAINTVLELHKLLATPGAIEKVLGTVRALRPKIVTVVEQEADHNSPAFLGRFNEALHYYSTMFDSLEGCGTPSPTSEGPGSAGGGASQDHVMTEVYLGRQIHNVVACEGAERTERHETLAQWRRRMQEAGFEPVHIGSNAFKQASMLLALFAGGDGYRVEEKDGCLMLGWHTRPLITTSAWRLARSTPSAAAY